MPQYDIICSKCKNFNYEKTGFTCKAFENGIPEDIVIGNFVHLTKYPGQKNDIVFEKE